MPLTSHTDGKTLLYEVTTQPTIGTSTFDMRANSKHIGNQVTEVTLKSVVSNSPSKAESTIQVQKDAPLQLEWNGKKTPKIETTPVASTEFGQAFVNSHTLNYKIDLLPDGKHIVRVK
jgi:hypothetical protein